MSIRDDLLAVSREDYGELYQHHLLEQYKLYVEMADRVSQRRMMANTFFASVNSLMLTVYGAVVSVKLTSSDFGWRVPILLAGVLLSITWALVIRSYRQLNSGKFDVVHEIEALLPLSPYAAEWTALGRGKDICRYLPLTHVEVWVPRLFFIVYIALFVWGECID